MDIDQPHETIDKEEAWGTWEELLLASAVHRHGTKSWDSVAGEIQKRTSNITPPSLTPRDCKQRFLDLTRRYTHPQNDAVGVDNTYDNDTIPWLDELRNLRIAELKRQLERYSLSIVKLQLKVKKLEEREEICDGKDKLDLEANRPIHTEPEKSPESAAGKPVAADDVDRDDQSVAQSNSTDLKSGKVKIGEAKVENEPETARTGDDNREPDCSGNEKPIREESWNGSSDSIAKGMVNVMAVKLEPDCGASESPELWETVAESKGLGEKDSSDVQSSVKKEESGDKVHCGSCWGDGRETEDQSRALKGIVVVESQPLVDFLEILRSHKLGSVFERLLESQETLEYRDLIRQHIDFKTLKRNVEEGWYLDSELKFFRDLLLLVNNAIVFFSKKSSESIAAIELRQFISFRMAQRNAKANLSAEKQTSLPPISLPSKQAQEPSDSLLLKPEMAGIITVCRKRSSIAAKGSTSSGFDRKREQIAALAESKPLLEFKQTTKSSIIAEKPGITKVRTRDGSASSSRSSKKNEKNLAYTNYDENPVAISIQNQGKVGSPTEPSQPNSEKQNPVVAVVKKRSAANFLNRLKRTSSSYNGPLLDTLKSSMLSAEKDSGISEKKKSGSIKVDDKEKVIKRNLGGRQQNEESSPTKKRIGRPPKNAVAPSPVRSGKRSRAVGDTDAEASKHPKKRSRK